MKIVVFEATEWERQACSSLAPHHVVECLAGPLAGDSADRYTNAEAITTFIRSDLSAAVLRRMPKLRLIATRSTGFDHIDLAYCRQAAITVCNVPDYGDHTVAEHVFALLLALSRHVVEAVGRTRRGDFSQGGLRGFDLAGKTLGVVGAGRIGQRVIAIGKGFGMEAIAFDAHPDPIAAKQLGFRFASLDELLAAADVITLHLPGGEATRQLIGEAEFARMKPGAVLINTSRGGVMDSEALVRALSSGRLAGAGLDVVAEEGALGEEAEIFRTETAVPVERMRALLADHALLSQPNVIVTPHIAYDTEEAVARIIETTLGNIAAFETGSPQNVVN
ncbi:hydroxyacid dehydrogenase [Phenylobacterium sp. 20VBR1]|uniref:Hydroxyacid dehydrogenase n=1 Tax=Phenylobacterium glaciei TaxID=2803784 RepID=A0A941CYN9_9CAUL|nr:hydroxyacid dehydrogenase [Phenylobacterium glaciei]MBR7618747.1 hydroxyacid dehydrogenase [Phenylobacterium glaciei]QQZ51117.1 hydroxyacid dehydrogenase [Phenylobacterium glaciei]